MSVPVSILLTFLALAACRGRGATLPPTSTLLQESINLLSELLKMKVSCDKTNVTNIFAGSKTDDKEILCKATTVMLELRSCHWRLEGVFYNLLSLVRRESAGHKAPCPVAAGNTTSLHRFLVNLHRVFQRLHKDWK